VEFGVILAFPDVQEWHLLNCYKTKEQWMVIVSVEYLAAFDILIMAHLCNNQPLLW